MLQPITPKQLRFLEHFDSFARANGYAPSFQELADQLGMKSLATVAKYLDVLVGKGYIQRIYNMKRSAEVTAEGVAYLKKLMATRRELGKVA